MILTVSAGAETIRQRAETHFAIAGWSVNSSVAPPVERKSVALPGEEESFAVMTPLGDAGLVSVYPELEGLGKLDYTEIDEGLLALFGKVADSLKKRTLESSVCVPARSFLGPVNSFRLAKIPPVIDVQFSRPEVAETGLDGLPAASGKFRLVCEEKKGADAEYLFMTVSASNYNGSWLVNDVSYDGKKYAELAEQN